MKSFIILLFIFFYSESISSQVLNITDSLPLAESEYLESWNYYKYECLGIKGSTPGKNLIDTIAAKKMFKDRNWFPINKEKRILCGKIKKWNTYKAILDWNEKDWNIYVVPNSSFKILIDSTKEQYCNWRNDWFENSHDTNVIECEVTPNSEYGENRYYNRGKWVFENCGLTYKGNFSNVLDSNVCIFGPWVKEISHGGKPEIHPIELIWFNNINSDDSKTLISICDGSKRFSGSDDFLDGNDSFYAWTKPPLCAEFEYAFELNPEKESIVFDVTMKAEFDAFEENEKLEYDRPPKWKKFYENFSKNGDTIVTINNKTILKINEKNKGNYMGTGFKNLRKKKNGNILGYLSIRVRVGKSTSDPGYAEIKLKPKTIPLISK